MRIVEIAMDCGFSDAKYLIKYFRRFFHATPSDFRKAHQVDSAALACQRQYRDIPFDRAVRLLSAAGAGDHIE
jgi:AraC-like DNA-binding protein